MTRAGGWGAARLEGCGGRREAGVARVEGQEQGCIPVYILGYMYVCIYIIYYILYIH